MGCIFFLMFSAGYESYPDDYALGFNNYRGQSDLRPWETTGSVR